MDPLSLQETHILRIKNPSRRIHAEGILVIAGHMCFTAVSGGSFSFSRVKTVMLQDYAEHPHLRFWRLGIIGITVVWMWRL